jgi:hypothetical protein
MYILIVTPLGDSQLLAETKNIAVEYIILLLGHVMLSRIHNTSLISAYFGLDSRENISV